MTRTVLLLAGLAMLAGCSDLTRAQQRALSGGAIGAAGGAVLAAATGGTSVVAGALIGGGTGATIGALTK